LAVSLINSNNMLFCANNAASGNTRQFNNVSNPNNGKVNPIPLTQIEKKPNPFVDSKKPSPRINPVKPPVVQYWFDEPIKDEPLSIDGKDYKNIDDFLNHIKVDKSVNTKDLRPGMKREIVELYKLALEEGFKFRILCGIRTPKHNADNVAKAEAAGRSGMVAVNSLHKKEAGLAVDIKTDELLVSQKMKLGELWEKRLHHLWG